MSRDSSYLRMPHQIAAPQWANVGEARCGVMKSPPANLAGTAEVPHIPDRIAAALKLPAQ
jgi:hypothetical protein